MFERARERNMRHGLLLPLPCFDGIECGAEPAIALYMRFGASAVTYLSALF
jgi:hypothetical protein